MDFSIDKEYYKILGIERNASLDSITKAYYREKFENDDVPFWQKDKINEAYSILSDQYKREKYDNFLDSLNKESSINEISKNEESNEASILDFESKTEENLEEQQHLVGDIEKNDSEQNIEPISVKINMIDSKYNEEETIFHDINSIDKHPKDVLKDFYQKKLDQKINKLLIQNPNNYNLEMNKLRIENEMELISKIIEFKNNQKIKPDKISERQEEINALSSQLKELVIKLDKINDKIKSCNKEASLTKINKKINKIDVEINKAGQNISFDFFKITKLELKKKYYELRRDNTFNGIKLINGFISKTQNGILNNYNKGKNFINGISQNLRSQYIKEINQPNVMYR